MSPSLVENCYCKLFVKERKRISKAKKNKKYHQQQIILLISHLIVMSKYDLRHYVVYTWTCIRCRNNPPPPVHYIGWRFLWRTKNSRVLLSCWLCSWVLGMRTRWGEDKRTHIEKQGLLLPTPGASASPCVKKKQKLHLFEKVCV